MELKGVQKQADEWVSQHKEGYWSPPDQMLILTEEIGELAREVNHRFGPKKKKSGEDKKELGDEIADVIFILACLANSQEIDLEDAFKRNMEKKYTRDHNRFEKK